MFTISKSKIDQPVSNSSAWEEAIEVDQDHLTFEMAVPKAKGGVNNENDARCEMGKWLRENIGPQVTVWDYKLIAGPDDQYEYEVFLFLHEEDAMAFKLTWL